MSEGSMWRDLMQWVYGASTLVSFICEIAILVVVATIVRRHRPDAYRGLMTWAIGSVAVYVFLGIVRMVTPFVSRSDGMESYFRASSLLAMVGILLHVVLVVIFLKGLIAIAQPPKPITVEGTPPYR